MADESLDLEVGGDLSGVWPARILSNNLGRSMSTGQASLHAPHKLDARARYPNSEPPKSPGEMTEPIGPG